MKDKKMAIVLIILIALLGIGGIVYAVYSKPAEEVEEKPKPKEPDKEPVEYVDKDFNIKFVKTVNSTQSGNYLVSPYSVEIALNMLKDGAKGDSAKQIVEVVGERVINDVTIPNRVGVANAIFIKEQYKEYIEESYVSTLKNDYDAEVLYDEFITPNVINNWVKEKTRNMIEKILDEMSEDFVLGIADALAIDVDWANQFECISTSGDNFIQENGSKMKVEMMHKNFTYNASYFETENAKGVILPYATYDETGEEVYGSKAGNQLEFVGILPNEKASTYVEKLTSEELAAIDSNKQDISSKLELNLAIPRFSYDFDLDGFMNVLKTMGIKDVFDEERADLTGMMTRENIYNIDAENLYVATAIHKTHIDFNEKGTKAAAVTYFGVDKASAAIEDKKPKIIDLDFDKSFVYMIRDVNTKEILFFGLVDEPNKWNGSTCSN